MPQDVIGANSDANRLADVGIVKSILCRLPVYTWEINAWICDSEI